MANLRARGAFSRRADLLTECSGSSFYEVRRRDLQVALDDTQVRANVLVSCSPSGEANGCGELARAVCAARGVKPAVACVGGLGASADHQLATAASEALLDRAATVSSIGCVIGFKDRRQQEVAVGIRSVEFVSSKSPPKHGDPATEAEASECQCLADVTAQVFMEAAARHRGRNAQAVIEGFGGRVVNG